MYMCESEDDAMRKKSVPIDFSAMQASAEKACALLKVLANPDRLLLM